MRRKEETLKREAREDREENLGGKKEKRFHHEGHEGNANLCGGK
jgi:hypothetical protein